MDNEHTRSKIQGLPLDTTVEVVLQEKGADVRISTEGIDRLPLRVELGFLPGCQLRTDHFILEGNAGESITLLQGDFEVSSAQGERISISSAFGKHNITQRSDGAYPQSAEHFTVYLTDYTPVDRVLRIRNTTLFPIH